MNDKYDQQDGAPHPRPDSGEAASTTAGEERDAFVNERGIEEGLAGQGLGQLNEEDEKRLADAKQQAAD
jgi:hypothetical protein